MFKSSFSFNGRIRRLEYGISQIILMVFAFAVVLVLHALAVAENTASIFLLAAVIPVYWFIFAQGSKRCHDLGNSGWFQLIPFYGFWLLFADGKIGVNEFGPNPKGLGNIDEVEEIGSYLNK